MRRKVFWIELEKMKTSCKKEKSIVEKEMNS